MRVIYKSMGGLCVAESFLIEQSWGILIVNIDAGHEILRKYFSAQNANELLKEAVKTGFLDLTQETLIKPE